MQRASGGNNMAHHCLCLCVYVCMRRIHGRVFSCRLCMCMYLNEISVCMKPYALSFPLAVRVPGSIQHLDQQVSLSCAATLTHSTDLHSSVEGEATQLLTFPRFCMQSQTVLSYCNRVPAMFHHVQQSTDSVLECRVALYTSWIVLLCFWCCIMCSDSPDIILEDKISPHKLLTDAWCPVVAGPVVTKPPEGWLC